MGTTMEEIAGDSAQGAKSPSPSSNAADGIPRRLLALTNMTSEDYCNTYWPQLRAAIDKLLEGPPPPHHLGPVIEFEPMYSAAYKCVCQQHSEALYNDLMSHIERHFVRVAIQLQNEDESQLIDHCFYVIHRAMYSLDGIIPVFTYLNKVYVSTKLSSNLRTELQSLFCRTVIDPIIDKLVAIVKQTTETKPFSVAPQVMSSVIKNLHKLNPNYSQKYPQPEIQLALMKNPQVTEVSDFESSNSEPPPPPSFSFTTRLKYWMSEVHTDKGSELSTWV